MVDSRLSELAHFATAAAYRACKPLPEGDLAITLPGSADDRWREVFAQATHDWLDGARRERFAAAGAAAALPPEPAGNGPDAARSRRHLVAPHRSPARSLPAVPRKTPARTGLDRRRLDGPHPHGNAQSAARRSASCRPTAWLTFSARKPSKLRQILSFPRSAWERTRHRSAVRRDSYTLSAGQGCRRLQRTAER